MNFKYKIVFIFGIISLLSASCNPFIQQSPAGLVKTLNGGADWQFINKFKDAKNGSLTGLNISSLQLDTSHKERIFAGSYNAGLFLSEDSGATWVQILSKISVYDFVLDPQDSNHIYVGGIFGDHGKVLVTKDGGKSWEEIFNEASSQNAVRSLAINPSNSNELIIGLTAGALIKSTDAGATWKLLKNYQDRINKIRWQQSAIYVLFRSKGLFKSTDAGENFYDNNFGLKNSQNFFQATINNSNDNVFYQFAASYTNPSLLYVTSGNGLYKSVDGGNVWAKLPVPVVDKSVALRSIAIAPSVDSTLYVSAGATVYKSLDGGTQWKTQGVTTVGFINVLLIDPLLPEIAYAGIYNQQ